MSTHITIALHVIVRLGNHLFIGDTGATMAKMSSHHEPELAVSKRTATASKGSRPRWVIPGRAWAHRTFWNLTGRAERTWPIKAPEWKPFGNPPKSWLPDVACALGFIVITVMLLWQTPLTELDQTVRIFLNENRALWLDWVARVLNNLGAGRVVAPLVLFVTLWCAVRYKSIRPLLMYTVAYMPLGIIFLMKHGFGRMLSHPGEKIGVIEKAPEKLELFTFIGAATAYPSGHAANTIVWFGLAILVIGAALPPWLRIFLLIGPPVVVGFTQTYMGLHWITDAPAGYLLGILIIRSVRRIPWDTVPLGPLARFEPASPEIIVSATVTVGGLLLFATKWLPAMILGVFVCILGALWMLKVLRQRRP